MDFGIIWLVGALLAIVPTGHALMRDFGETWWIPGVGWSGEPDGMDWGFAAMLSPLISFTLWPAAMIYVGVSHFKTRKKRKLLKLKHIKRRNDDAFKRMREARRTLLNEKKRRHYTEKVEWNKEFDAADVKDRQRIAMEKWRKPQAIRQEFGGETFFSAKDGYFTVKDEEFS